MMVVTRAAETSPTPGEFYLNRARNGDAAAWEPIVRHYQQPIFRITYLIWCDSVEAEDVTQKCFIRAYRKLHRLSVGQPFKPWLF